MNVIVESVSPAMEAAMIGKESGQDELMNGEQT